MSSMDDTQSFSPYRPDGKLFGFICVVTGADQPVGKAIVHELAAHGAAGVYACAHTKPTSLKDELATEFPNTRILPYSLHVSDEQDTLTLIDDILNAWGRLDVWVTSAGLLGPSSISQTSPSDLQKCFESNSLAPFLALKYAPPAMAKTTPKGTYPNAAPKDQEYGSIIVVSSIASTHGGYWGPAVTISSHAALGVVKAGVATLKGTAVRINCISPGHIDVGVSGVDSDTNGVAGERRGGFGLERAGRPGEVARVAGFLASGFSSFVTGVNIEVDGGASVVGSLGVAV